MACGIAHGRDVLALFPPEDKHALVGLACTPPEKLGFPFTHWSLSTLTRAYRDESGIESISPEHIRQWLKSMALQPHRSRYWLNSRDPDFDAKMRDIVALYTGPPANSIVVCFDERTGMQALERKYPTRLMSFGRPERREFEYIRHGTLDLLAALVVHTGEVFAGCYDRHTRLEVADFFSWLLPQLPRGKKIHLIMDNLKVHQTAEVQQVLDRYSHRLEVHWTPYHASWLNQIEIFFSILQRRVLKRGTFLSTDELADKVIAFIEWYSEHEAKPFRWNYTGNPIHQ